MEWMCFEKNGRISDMHTQKFLQFVGIKSSFAFNKFGVVYGCLFFLVRINAHKGVDFNGYFSLFILFLPGLVSVNLAYWIAWGIYTSITCR